MTEKETKVETSSVSLNTFYCQKAGMTRVFDESGNHVPVTVVKLISNYIIQAKTKDKDGYESYQLGYGQSKEKNTTKPVVGKLKKASVDEGLRHFSEVKPVNGLDEGCVGSLVDLKSFEKGSFIDVTAITKGKGFQGVIKKFGFSGGPAAHGSHFHRGTGSIGNRATPGRVFKGKKMPGRMGGKTKTIQNLQIQEINLEKGFALIRGSVPGPKDGYIRVSKAIKK